MSAPDASELARMRYEDNSSTCAREGHVFRSSWETNEAIGPCSRCGISVASAEAEAEENAIYCEQCDRALPEDEVNRYNPYVEGDASNDMFFCAHGTGCQK